MAEKKEILKLSGINKCFGNVVVAKDISLTVISNQLHALIGPNGAGKTTLIKMISGELKPDQGVVMLLDRKVNHLSEIARVHRGCIRSFQVSSIIGSMTVFENILLAVKQKRSILKMLFRKFQSNSSESSFVYQTLNQLSLETMGTKVASTLSHGDKRKLELAMALAMGPKILLLDEPFAGLDQAESSKLIELLKSIKKNMPILLIEHDMQAVFALADKISVLNEGEIIESGSVEKIRRSKLVQNAYLGGDL
jgi:branched-chain amino acid transport system ATP-binding protein